MFLFFFLFFPYSGTVDFKAAPATLASEKFLSSARLLISVILCFSMKAFFILALYTFHLLLNFLACQA